jgi:hypothetical protein
VLLLLLFLFGRCVGKTRSRSLHSLACSKAKAIQSTYAGVSNRQDKNTLNLKLRLELCVGFGGSRHGRWRRKTAKIQNRQMLRSKLILHHVVWTFCECPLQAWPAKPTRGCRVAPRIERPTAEFARAWCKDRKVLPFACCCVLCAGQGSVDGVNPGA